MTTPLLGVVCHPQARIRYSLPVCKILPVCMILALTAYITYIIGAPKFKVGHVTLTTSFKGNFPFLRWDLTLPICVPNLTIVASAIPEIWLVPTRI